jgi:hypothetical protein
MDGDWNRDMRNLRVSVEDRILESVEAGSIMTLRQVTDAANDHADGDTFILGQGAVNACLFRMAKKGKVLVYRVEFAPDTPIMAVPRTLFKFLR